MFFSQAEGYLEALTQAYIQKGMLSNQDQQKGNNQRTTQQTKHLYDIYTMLVQRRRRWADVV